LAIFSSAAEDLKVPPKDRLRRLKLGLAGQAVLIEDRFGGIQRLAIE